MSSLVCLLVTCGICFDKRESDMYQFAQNMNQFVPKQLINVGRRRQYPNSDTVDCLALATCFMVGMGRYTHYKSYNVREGHRRCCTEMYLLDNGHWVAPSRVHRMAIL